MSGFHSEDLYISVFVQLQSYTHSYWIVLKLQSANISLICLEIRLHFTVIVINILIQQSSGQLQTHHIYKNNKETTKIQYKLILQSEYSI